MDFCNAIEKGAKLEMAKTDMVVEPQREIPVVKRVDIVVAGGSPTGVAAALAAARNGADVLLIERYGFLGGQTTAGLIFSPHPRALFSASGKQIMGGIAQEMIQRAIELEGSGYSWQDISNDKFFDVAIDPEIMKYLLLEMIEKAGVRLLLHSLTVGSLVENKVIKGVIVENKSGRQAVLAKTIIDATGDGDVAAGAGAEFEYRGKEGIFPGMLYRMGNVDMAKTFQYVKKNPDQFWQYPQGISLEEFEKRFEQDQFIGMTGFYDLVKEAIEKGDFKYEEGIISSGAVSGVGFAWLGKGRVMVWKNNLANVDCLNIRDLNYAEVQARKHAWTTASFYKKYVPGFESAYLLDTPAQIGIRETRRIIGEYVLTGEDVLESRRFDDAIAWISGHDEAPRVPNGHGIPYKCLVPKEIDNLLVAGRCISVSAPVAINAIRGILGGIATGQAAGTAAALAVKSKVPPRQIDIPRLQKMLKEGGAIFA